MRIKEIKLTHLNLGFIFGFGLVLLVFRVLPVAESLRVLLLFAEGAV